LSSFAPALERRASAWASFGVEWVVEPVARNYGKPVVVARFESVSWLGDVMVWITGEAELATARLADNWMVNKHYDLLGPGPGFPISVGAVCRTKRFPGG
jgi:hypothetical protein